jgi:hypothetical protein
VLSSPAYGKALTQSAGSEQPAVTMNDFAFIGITVAFFALAAAFARFCEKVR